MKRYKCSLWILFAGIIFFMTSAGTNLVAQDGECVLNIKWREFDENFKLDNFVPLQSGGWIQVPYAQTGRIIMEKFQYPSGTYNIKIYVAVDKKGYASTINLYVNDKKLASVKEDKDTGSATYEFKNIKIDNGDKLIIEGINDKDELVRFSRLQIIKKGIGSQQQSTPIHPIEKKVSIQPEVVTTSNLINNGDFEKTKEEKPVDWKVSQGEKNIQVIKDGENHCLLLDNTIDGSYTVLQQRLPEPLGMAKEYLLSFKAKIQETVGDPVICLMVTNPAWQPTTNVYIERSSSWKEYKIKFKPKGGYNLIIIRLCKGKAKLLLDDIKLIDLTKKEETAVIPGITFLTVVKKNADSISVKSNFLEATITTFGGKISILKADNYNWPVLPAEKWSTGIAKVWIKEDKDKELLTKRYNLQVIEETKEKVKIKANYQPKGILSGISIERIFVFFANKAKIEVTHTILNKKGKTLKITPRIHNYLNIWRSYETTPRFTVYISGKEIPTRLLLVPKLGETVKKGNRDSLFAGVIDNEKNNGLLFLMKEAGPDEWMLWSGFEKSNGTLEMCYNPVTLKDKERWQVSYSIFPTSNVPSFGAVSNKVIASVGEPDIYLYFPEPFKDASIELKTETGGFYQYFKKEIKAKEIVKVGISSIQDPGKGNLSVKRAEGIITLAGIPRKSNVFPKKLFVSDDAKPCQYLPLTVKPIPDPGENSFIYYASDYYQHEIYASPDMPTMIAFGQKNRLPKYGRIPEIRLIFDLPEGFKVHGGRFIQKPIETEEIEIGGKKYTRFRIKITHLETRSGITEVIVSTNIKAPSSFQSYYATEINGKLFHQREISLHIISIPEVHPPKKIMTWFWHLWGVLRDYPDETAFNKIGFAYPNPEYFARIIKKDRHPGKVGVGYLRFAAKEEDAKCVKLDGIKVGGLACPTYRGKEFNQVIETGKRAIDMGVYEHSFDPERRNGKEICFCDRCLSQFKDYFQANSNLPYKNPKEFMQNPSNYPQYHKLWIKFKIEKEHQRQADYRRAMLDYMAEKGLDTRRFKLFFAANAGWRDEKKKWIGHMESSLQDPLILKDICDYYAPMYYIEINGRFRMAVDMLEISEELAGIHQYSKGKVKVCPTLSAGYPYSEFVGNIEPNGMMKYQILEAFAGGAKGVIVYSEGWFDALDMKFVAEAIKQILPVEDIIVDGKPTDKVKSLDRKVFVKGIESKKGAVILVSEYSVVPKESKIEYPVDSVSSVIDLSTMKEITTISPDNPTFKIRLDENRAKLFFVGNRFK